MPSGAGWQATKGDWARGNVMGKRARGAAMFVSGLALVGLPFMVGQTPAGASGDDNKTVALTFQGVSGRAETCTLTANSHHDTGEPDGPFATATLTAADGSECTGDLSLSISFKDKQGVGRRAETDSPGVGTQLNLYVEGAYTSVGVHGEIIFNRCDLSHSASCHLVVDTAPK